MNVCHPDRWCTATDGQESCYTFSVQTIHKSDRAKGYYYGVETFMVFTVLGGALYAVVEVVRLVQRLTNTLPKSVWPLLLLLLLLLLVVLLLL